MDFGKYIGFFLLSTFKFLVTPFGGAAAGLTFAETYISCVSGGIFSAAIFFFSSGYFMKKAKIKHLEKLRLATESGEVLPVKKKFTKMNKYIVKLKHRFGIVGISMYAPLFLSVPVGSIITAKFYGTDKRTFPIIVFGMFFNGAITTGITFLIASFF
jgi:hypothetical protein